MRTHTVGIVEYRFAENTVRGLGPEIVLVVELVHHFQHVFARQAGPAVLNLWYANATPVVRPMDVTVDGVPVAPGLAFGNTPAWSDWETRTLLVDLHSGMNTVRATAATAAGGPHVQCLEVDRPAS